MRTSVQKRTIALSIATTVAVMMGVLLGNFILWSLVAKGDPKYLLRDSFNPILALGFFSCGMFFFDRVIGKGNPTRSALGALCAIILMGIWLTVTMQVVSHELNEVVGAVAMITGLFTVVNFAFVYYLGKIYGEEYRRQVKDQQDERVRRAKLQKEGAKPQSSAMIFEDGRG